MSSPTAATQLIKSHSLVSDQMTKERLEIILRELSTVLINDIPGEVVEFGCYSGTTSLFLKRLLDYFHSTKELHLYDSFQGLPAKTIEDASVTGSAFKAGELKTPKRQLIINFKKAGLKTPRIHKGWFDALRDQDIPNSIAFAFLDGDFYKSIQVSLDKIIAKMSQGGIIVIDDYQKSNLPGATRAVDEFCSNNNLNVAHQHNLAIIKLVD